MCYRCCSVHLHCSWLLPRCHAQFALCGKALFVSRTSKNLNIYQSILVKKLYQEVNTSSNSLVHIIVKESKTYVLVQWCCSIHSGLPPSWVQHFASCDPGTSNILNISQHIFVKMLLRSSQSNNPSTQVLKETKKNYSIHKTKLSVTHLVWTALHIFTTTDK